MHQAGYYGQTEKPKIAQSIREEGFDPLLISDSPGHTYAPHSHPETKLLAFLGGCMEVSVLGTRFECVSGDRLVIPGNTEHSSVVGLQGCEYFWSERLGGPLESPLPAGTRLLGVKSLPKHPWASLGYNIGKIAHIKFDGH